MITDVTLQAWRTEVAARENCPWAGPRPLGPEDTELLCGRDDDAVRFRRAVDQHRLVFLTGSTGVGKTSLLLGGLVPELRESGFTVASCRDWSGTAEQENPAEFLTQRIRTELVAQGLNGLPEDPSMFAILNESLGARLVLILDQFEELIRDAPRFKDGLFRALAHLNNNTSIKIVVSLRSEYLHELRPLERAVKPMSFTQFMLNEILDTFAPDVIRSGNKAQPGAIDDDFVDELALLWANARQASTVADVHIGLLHLQALLYTLHSRAGDESVGQMTLKQFESEQGLAASQPDEIFVVALQDSVDQKLDRCKEVAESLGLDKYLVEGTALIVGRMVRHLSSAGYKLVREAFDLAQLTLDQEVEALRRGLSRSRQNDGDPFDERIVERQERTLFETLVRIVVEPEVSDTEGHRLDLFARREDIAVAADQAVDDSSLVTWAARQHVGADPRHADIGQVTSGPMLGLAPAAVYIEELRRFAFALEWMRLTDLVRLSSPRRGVVMIALVHDGFGVALDLWAKSDALSQCGAIFGFTAPLGAEFDWKQEDGFLEALDGTTAEGRNVRVFANFRWRGAWISADFRQVVFANCDFRGSQFANCQLQGVTFVNCLLDGVMFSDCTVVGSPSGREAQWASGQAPFELHGVEDLVRVLASYRNDSVESTALLSDRPEMPAVSRVPDPNKRVLRPHTGGVAVYGGRASSLLIRRAYFENDGCFSLRETAGSGVDVVEHDQAGTYEILSSRLRHVTFSSSPTVKGGGKQITIHVKDSVLFQVWLGQDLNGTFTVHDSIAVQCWNASHAMAAVLALDSENKTCRYHGLIGFDVGPEHERLMESVAPVSLDEFDPNFEFAKRAVGMDYRRHAADTEVDLHELERRAVKRDGP